MRFWFLDAGRRADCFARGQPLDADFEARVTWFREMCENIGIISGHHVVVIGADVFEVDSIGPMPSAHPSTGNSNTGGRSISLYIAYRKPNFAVGDDALKRGKLTAEGHARLRAQGIDVRDARHDFNEVYEFNSLLISFDAQGEPVTDFQNFDKLIVRLVFGHGMYTLENEAGVSAIASARLVLRHSAAKLAVLDEVASMLGYPVIGAAENVDSDED
jgi:hypothetical protein